MRMETAPSLRTRWPYSLSKREERSLYLPKRSPRLSLLPRKPQLRKLPQRLSLSQSQLPNKPQQRTLLLKLLLKNHLLKQLKMFPQKLLQRKPQPKKQRKRHQLRMPPFQLRKWLTKSGLNMTRTEADLLARPKPVTLSKIF